MTKKKTEMMTTRPDFLLGLASIFLGAVLGPKIVETWYSLTTVSISTSSLSLIELSEKEGAGSV